MYLWKRKTPLNFGSHLDPEFRIWEFLNFSHQCGLDRYNSTHYAKTTGAIFTKFGGKMAHGPRKKKLIFMIFLIRIHDFQRNFYHCIRNFCIYILIFELRHTMNA